MIVWIIGHGKSAIGTGLGAEIDGADVVVRFWNCHWQDAGDYGRRYDVGIVTLLPNEVAWASRRQRVPKQWWLYDIRGEAIDFPALEPVSKFTVGWAHDRLEKAVGEEVAGFRRLELTRGGAAACHALRQYPGSELHLLAFDAIRDGALQRGDYAPEAIAEWERLGRKFKWQMTGHRSATHHFAGERAAILSAAEAYGGTVRWH